MKTYWKNYWDNHVKTVDNQDKFSQVLRVKEGKPQSNEDFQKSIQHVIKHLDINENCKVLDLCCGNGLFSNQFQKLGCNVVGVDFCSKLIETAIAQNDKSIHFIQSDVLNVSLENNTFDRVLLAAALQHFSESEIIQLFDTIFNVLKRNGKLLITDILNQDKIWNFYNTIERKNAYFTNKQQNTPILGTWLNTQWLEELAMYSKFSRVEIITQPPEFIYSHYRFDLLCVK